jgi:hypothetical protein
MRIGTHLPIVGDGSDRTSGAGGAHMVSVEQVDREPSVLVGVLWLAGLLVFHFALGYIPWIWERWSAWWFGVPTCPYPQCGNWIPR